MIRRTKQVGLWSDRSPYDIYIPQDQPAPKEGIGIDPGLTVVTTMVPAASREDFCPQTILKFNLSQ